jgi:hypothetical protein
MKGDFEGRFCDSDTIEGIRMNFFWWRDRKENSENKENSSQWERLEI